MILKMVLDLVILKVVLDFGDFEDGARAWWL